MFLLWADHKCVRVQALGLQVLQGLGLRVYGLVFRATASPQLSACNMPWCTIPFFSSIAKTILLGVHLL